MSNPAAGRPYLTGISTLINLSTHRFPKRNHEPTVELDSSLGYQMYAHLNSLAPINNQSLTSIQKSTYSQWSIKNWQQRYYPVNWNY